MKTSVKFLLFRFSALVVLALSLSAENTPLILPTEDPETGPPMRGIWPTEPGIRYELQESTTLEPDSWTTVAGFPTEAAALAQQHAFELDVDKKFYRVVELDEQPPEIVRKNPGDGSFGVGRFSVVTVELTDRTGIDPDSITFSIDGGDPITVSDPTLTFADGTLTYDLGGDFPLGNSGDEVAIELVVADPLGNSATFTWTFELEKELEEATGLFVFGSLQAQRAGQRVGNIPTRVIAQRYGGLTGPVRMSGTTLDWEIDDVGEDFIIISYTNGAPTFEIGQPIANIAPRIVDEIFSRIITGIQDDPPAKVLTLNTEDADAWQIMTSGSFRTDGDVLAFDVDEDGVILGLTTLAASAGEVELPTIQFDWTNRRVMGSYESSPGNLSFAWGTDLPASAPNGSSWSTTLTLNRATINATPVFSIEGDLNPIRFRTETALRLNPSVTATYNFFSGPSISAESKGTLFSKRKVIWIVKTPFWIDVNPRVDFKANFNAGLDGSIQTGAHANFTISQVADYDSSRTPQLIYGPRLSNPSHGFEWPPQVHLGGSVGTSVALIPEINITINSLAGVFVNVDPKLSATGSTSLIGPDVGTINLNVALGANLNAGTQVGKARGGWLPQMEPFSLFKWERNYQWPSAPSTEPLAFVLQPQGQSVVQGGTISLSSQVNRDSGVSYEWYRDGASQGVFSGNNFTRSNARLSDAGDYHVVARSGGQAVVSETAPVTVVPPAGAAPAGFAYIPAGSFQMGDSFSEGSTAERPVHSVYLSGFYMGRTEVTYAQWQEVYDWAVVNGYSFDNAGAGKAANHPVHTVSWYDVVKWCNAASEREGLAPVYRTGDGSVYRTGQLAPVIAYGNRGYRLPTEAEWEKAARGGLSSKRFPWGNTISHSEANYLSSSGYSYDVSSTRGDHPSYDDVWPYTSPVGSFAPNGYGLYDMAGNVWEWCGDWYADYPSSSVSNPTGPGSGAYRVSRGGSCGACHCRVANRGRGDPDYRLNGIGFRLARSQ